uniref:Tryptophanyl-tRNA synthetase n=1 Tax=Acrobeloides nanus TaxID=290746 RepID=A0A914C264_9BILA
MSKSDQSKWATLNITDPADLVYSKIKKSMSDFEPNISFDLEKRPAISNLITIYSAFTGKTLDAIVEESIGLNQAQFKQKVIEVAEETLRPIRTEYERLIQDRTHLEDVLRQGSFQAREIAQKNIREIKQIIGFL